MCGAPCAALTSGCRRNATGFHAGRLIGYMAGVAVAASSMQVLGIWSQLAPALKPVWMLLQLALLVLGLWWLATGRPLNAMKRGNAVPVKVFTRRPPALKSALSGPAWVAWPCGALQAALLVSAMASDAMGGALVMGAFALASLPGLAAAPWAWGVWQAFRDRAAVQGPAMAVIGLPGSGSSSGPDGP
jgi:sulfite exporter TauE/SafE